MTRIKMTARVLDQRPLADGIFSMWIAAAGIASQARAGQFLAVYSKDGSRLLPRPISICVIDRKRGALRIVYRVAGTGTAEFSACRAGDTVEILGPLGNGFPDIGPEKSALLLGGGIGIPPMLELARQLRCAEKTAALGYRGRPLFLREEFEPYAKVLTATEDGSEGTKGLVLDAVRESGARADVLLACGPAPMLRAVKAYAAERGLECWLSLEERMACGIGACLGCVCASAGTDAHSNVRSKRVCRDGPVFAAGEVEP